MVSRKKTTRPLQVVGCLGGPRRVRPHATSVQSQPRKRQEPLQLPRATSTETKTSSIVRRQQRSDRPTGAIFNEPKVLGMVIRFEDLKIIQAAVFIGFLSQDPPTGYDDFMRKQTDGGRCCHERFLRRRLKHVIRIGMIEGNFLRFQRWQCWHDTAGESALP